VTSPDPSNAEPAGGDAPRQTAYEALGEGRIAWIWLNRPDAQKRPLANAVGAVG